MSLYPPEVAERSFRPRCAGRAADANAVGKAVSFECGTFVEISMRIDPVQKTIREAGFRTSGCGYMSAAADIACEALTGSDLAGLRGSLDGILAGLEAEAFPAGRTHCRERVLEAAAAAFASYRNSVISEFRGEEALVCTCFGITETALTELIERHCPASAEELFGVTNAGRGCGSCRMLIQELIDRSGPAAGTGKAL